MYIDFNFRSIVPSAACDLLYFLICQYQSDLSSQDFSLFTVNTQNQLYVGVTSTSLFNKLPEPAFNHPVSKTSLRELVLEQVCPALDSVP